eukprot:7547240-Pyramimonas_sp.AAC.1
MVQPVVQVQVAQAAEDAAGAVGAVVARQASPERETVSIADVGETKLCKQIKKTGPVKDRLWIEADAARTSDMRFHF